MSRYQLTPADLPYAAEFKANRSGYHSPGLQRVLNLLRGGPKAGKYVLVVEEPFKRWVLGRLPAERGQPVEILPDQVFTDLAEAEWAVFKLRWGGPRRPGSRPGRHLGGGEMASLLAYANRVSAAPGDSIDFMVSCEGAAHYDATLVRVIQGDINPAGPGYREEVIAHDFGGPLPGRYQPIHIGSYGLVADHALFRGLTSFGLQAAVWPTLPGRGEQTLISRQDAGGGAGFRLFLDGRGALALELRSAGGDSTVVSTGKPLIAERWYVVAGGYDAESGELSVAQEPLLDYPRVDDRGSAQQTVAAGLDQSTVAAPLMIAAAPAPDRPAHQHFNGRMDSPRLWSRPLAATELRTRLDPERGHPAYGDLLAAWDFSLGISTDRITDAGPSQLHGRLVNLPTRGVAGRKWTGEVHDWTQRPEHYGAVHFHDDDLYDCGWEVDFAFTVPETLRSGVYAVRLNADEAEYYVPFAVRAPRGKPTAPVAFLLPTASYLAYANNRFGIDASETEIVIGRLLQLNATDLFQMEHPELGLCFYDLHNDGSGVFYSSRLRPVINMQPKVVGHLGGAGSNLWQFNADTHILDWLERLGEPYDVVTDDDLETEGLAALDGYRAVITGSHPEYYSLRMLDALQAHVDRGGRLMYLGGNGFYWRISYHPTLPGVIECRKSEDGIRAFVPRPGEFFASFTGEYTGLWRRNGRAPNMLAGIGMVSQGFDISSPYVRTAASRDPRAAFIFEGVENEVIGDYGLSGGGAAGLELDAVDHGLGTPPNALVLASSERHTDIYLMVPEDLNDPVPGIGGTEAEIIRAEMVFFESPRGGAVFSTGSIAWAGSLSHQDYDNDVARITSNVLRRFIDETPFRAFPTFVESAPEQPESRQSAKGSRTRMVSWRSGLVDSSATGAPISSSMRRMYLTAVAGRSAQERAPWVLSDQPSRVW